MKKIITLIFVIAFVLPSQAFAVWWNPASWFSSNENTEVQVAPTGTTTSIEVREPQTAAQDNEVSKKPQVITPVASLQTSDAKTIEDLKMEVATLKVSLDNLYKAHSGLVDKHNELLEYTKGIATSNNSVGIKSDSSLLETRVAALERKVAAQNSSSITTSELEERLNDVCALIFSRGLMASTNRCPSYSGFLGSGTLEERIKKLEGGY